MVVKSCPQRGMLSQNFWSMVVAVQKLVKFRQQGFEVLEYADNILISEKNLGDNIRNLMLTEHHSELVW